MLWYNSVWRPEKQEATELVSESEGLRAKSSNVQGKEKREHSVQEESGNFTLT